MKPPKRRRSAPRRFETPDSGKMRPLWTTRQKRELVTGLRTQRGERVPEVTVQGRSPEEVSSYFSWLRGRAAREAVQTEYGKLVRQKKVRGIQDPAPIELWTDLATRICSTTEDAMAAAFSQMLTIASTEPVTLYHSIPSKDPLAASAQVSSSYGKRLQGSSEEELSSSGEDPTTNPNDGWNTLDFQKIYKYLSKAARGEELPVLSDFESAVILHLLHCIPDEFQRLDAAQIGSYLFDIYSFLTTELKREDDDEEEEETQSDAPPPNWKELGFCPLNPFMMPLELLRPKEELETPP